LLPELEENKDPFFFSLSFLLFNEDTALASCGGFEFLEEALEEK
jgi:hypothetical protein